MIRLGLKSAGVLAAIAAPCVVQAASLAPAPSIPLPQQETGYGPSLEANGPDAPPAAGTDLPAGPAVEQPGVTPVNPLRRSGATVTLQDALAQVYLTNPTLQAERAHLRSTDEGVPGALAGWRPTISYQLTPAFGYGTRSADQARGSGINPTAAESRWDFSQQVTLSQPLYRGGRTISATAQAEDNVRSERANLLNQEQTSFAQAVAAYVTVIEDQELYQLNVSNVSDLTAQLKATYARFQVGEVDRTDVAEAQAALAQGISERETAFGNLQTARAQYRQYIGELPNQLVDPEPLALPVTSAQQAETLASVNNPQVISAMYQDSAAKDAIDVAYANLMPEIDAQVTADYENQTAIRGQIQRGGTVGGQLTVPIYQGGSEYASIRQAKQTEQQSRKTLDATRRSAVESADQYWESYVAAKTTVDATRVQVRADEIALDGVEREALAGTETTLDVLQEEQLLLTARTTLVQNLATLVTDSYDLAQAIGRLSARDLGLKVPYYDEKAYYNAVRNLPFGTGDYATGQPGR